MATFDREQARTDGGAVLLKAAERVYGLIKTFGRCLIDRRAPEKARHTLEDLVGQRVFGIACGDPDGNDSDRLADDRIHTLLLGRDPVASGRLGVAADGLVVRDQRCKEAFHLDGDVRAKPRAGPGAGIVSRGARPARSTARSWTSRLTPASRSTK